MTLIVRLPPPSADPARRQVRWPEQVGSNEGEHTHAQGQPPRLAGEAVHANAEARIRVGYPLPVEATLLEPVADQRHSVWQPAVPSPDDGAAGLAQLGAGVDEAL